MTTRIFRPAALIVLVLAALALAVPAARISAAPAAVDVPAPLPGLEISVVGLGALPPSVKIAAGARALEIPVQSSGKGPVHRYVGASPLVFFREVPDAEGKLKREVIATVPYPPEWSRVLVVLLGDARQPGRGSFFVQAFDDSPEGFPAGTARIFNLFTAPLAANSGDALEQIPPGQSRLMRLSGSRARVWLKLARQNSAEWELLPTFVTQFSPERRLLLFLYETKGDDGQMEPVYQSIPESVPPVQATPAAGS